MWTVWVGGGEVNPRLIETHDQAIEIASDWYNRGYDDVQIEFCGA